MSREYTDSEIRNISWCEQCKMNRRITDIEFDPVKNIITEKLGCGHVNTTTPEIELGDLRPARKS